MEWSGDVLTHHLCLSPTWLLVLPSPPLPSFVMPQITVPDIQKLVNQGGGEHGLAWLEHS